MNVGVRKAKENKLNGRQMDYVEREGDEGELWSS